QRFFEGIDGARDQVGAVVGDHYFDPRRKSLLQFPDFDLDPVDDILCVLTLAHDHDAAHGLSLAVHLQQAAADGAPQLDGAQVLQVNGGDTLLGTDHDIFQVSWRLHVAASTDQVFGVGLLDQTSPHVLVGGLDRLYDLADGDFVSKE